MSSPASSETKAPNLLVIQLVVLAMFLGLGMFLGVAFFVRHAAAGREAPPVSGDLLSKMAMGLTILTAISKPVLVYLLTSLGRQQLVEPWRAAEASDDDGEAKLVFAARLQKLFFVQTIVGAALLEGASLFCTVAFMLEGNPTIAALSGLVALYLLFQIPRRGTFEAWAAETIRAVKNQPGAS